MIIYGLFNMISTFKNLWHDYNAKDYKSSFTCW